MFWLECLWLLLILQKKDKDKVKILISSSIPRPAKIAAPKSIDPHLASPSQGEVIASPCELMAYFMFS